MFFWPLSLGGDSQNSMSCPIHLVRSAESNISKGGTSYIEGVQSHSKTLVAVGNITKFIVLLNTDITPWYRSSYILPVVKRSIICNSTYVLVTTSDTLLHTIGINTVLDLKCKCNRLNPASFKLQNCPADHVLRQKAPSWMWQDTAKV